MKPRLACLQMGQRVRLTIGRDGPSQATAELREIEEKREICVDGRERLVIRKNKERERGKKENKGKGLSGSRWVSPSSVDGIRKQSEKIEKC